MAFSTRQFSTHSLVENAMITTLTTSHLFRRIHVSDNAIRHNQKYEVLVARAVSFRKLSNVADDGREVGRPV